MKLLSEYIARIFPNGTGSAAFTCKDERESHNTSCHTAHLQQGQINRILVYCGSFNPPHLGHLELLRYGFLRSGKDLNLIAAMIVPMGHNHIARKCKGSHPGLIFSKEERRLLWKEHPDFPPWAWLFDRGWEELVRFQAELKVMTERDGYKIRFVMLCGPDCRPRSDWNGKGTSGFDYNEIIVCDVAREGQISFEDGIDAYKGFTEWKQVGLAKAIVAGKEIEYNARQSAELAFQEEYNLDPVASLWRMVQVPEILERMLQQRSSLFDCHLIGDANAKVRFVRSWQDESRTCATCLQKADIIRVRDFSSTVQCKAVQEEKATNAPTDLESISDVTESSYITNAINRRHESGLPIAVLPPSFRSPLPNNPSFKIPALALHSSFHSPLLDPPTPHQITHHFRPLIPSPSSQPPPCTACLARKSFAPFRDISSTKVRLLMENTPVDQLKGVLETMVLSPILLVELWAQHLDKLERGEFQI